jgi:hypothetical protein
MNKGVYKAAFPLHEGRYDKDGPQGEKTDRRVSWNDPNTLVMSMVDGIVTTTLVASFPGVGPPSQFLQEAATVADQAVLW